MPEKSGYIYDGHQLTNDMLESTQTVFLVHFDGKACFAYLTRWPESERTREWSVWSHDAETGANKLRLSSSTYEACLMLLGAYMPGLRLSFEVLFSDTRMPDPYQ